MLEADDDKMEDDSTDSRKKCKGDVLKIEQKPMSELEQFARNLLEDYKCPICFGIVIEAQVLECSHMFCKTCIDKWFANREYCAVCRSSELDFELRPVTTADITIAKLFEKLPEVEQADRKQDIEKRN